MRLLFKLSVSFFLIGGFGVGAAAALEPTDLARRLAQNESILLVDVRLPTEYGEGHIPGAINVPLSLLPHKQLPVSGLVIVYGDGLGVIDEDRALAIARSKSGMKAEVLVGGYAGWLSATRLSTAAPGVVRERLPGITYQQLVAANKGDMVLVDLRSPTTAAAPATAAAATSTTTSKSRPATAARATDVLAEFAQKIGVPVVAPNGSVAYVAARVQRAAASASGTPVKAAAPAAAADSETKSTQLLVLVADNDSVANEAARQLRASGHFRFTVLIGGTEIIRHEGRQGTGRTDSELPVVPNVP